jgi:hypothetical protein
MTKNDRIKNVAIGFVKLLIAGIILVVGLSMGFISIVMGSYASSGESILIGTVIIITTLFLLLGATKVIK